MKFKRIRFFPIKKKKKEDENKRREGSNTLTKKFFIFLSVCARTVGNAYYTSWVESLSFLCLWHFFLRGPEGTSVNQKSTEQMAMPLKVKINK